MRLARRAGIALAATASAIKQRGRGDEEPRLERGDAEYVGLHRAAAEAREQHAAGDPGEHRPQRLADGQPQELPAVAPSAMRTPISCVRCATT